MKHFRGSHVALITPFHKGKVDMGALQALVEFHVKNGTNGIVPCGTTGESPTLSHEEHKAVITAVVEAAEGRVPVIAGTGSNSTEEAIQLTVFAKKAGADAVLSVVPYYNKPTQEGMFAHFEAIAKKADIPTVLYNIPGRCAAGLMPKTIARLAKIPSIVAVKESTGSMDQTSEIIAESGLEVLSGDDSLTLPLMSLGAVGVISVAANLFPREVSEMVKLAGSAQWEAARKRHYKLYPLVKALFLETNPIPVKAAMKILGTDTGELRLPLVPMSEPNVAVLKRELQVFARTAKETA